MEKKEFQLLPLLICVAIPLVPVFLVGVLTSGQTDLYATVRTPGFAPPAMLFPIVWGILYALMGISLYLIYQNGGSRKNYVLFGAQLAANLMCGSKTLTFLGHTNKTFQKWCIQKSPSMRFRLTGFLME